MSYDIDTIRYVSGSLTMTDEAQGGIAAYTPEGCFLLEADCWDGERITDPRWCGEGSGHAFAALIDDVLPATRGTAELLVVWEGGDSVTGIRVVDGVVTQHAVEYVLGEELS